MTLFTTVRQSLMEPPAAKAREGVGGKPAPTHCPCSFCSSYISTLASKVRVLDLEGLEGRQVGFATRGQGINAGTTD